MIADRTACKLSNWFPLQVDERLVHMIQSIIPQVAYSFWTHQTQSTYLSVTDLSWQSRWITDRSTRLTRATSARLIVWWLRSYWRSSCRLRTDTSQLLIGRWLRHVTVLLAVDHAHRLWRNFRLWRHSSGSGDGPLDLFGEDICSLWCFTDFRSLLCWLVAVAKWYLRISMAHWLTHYV